MEHQARQDPNFRTVGRYFHFTIVIVLAVLALLTACSGANPPLGGDPTGPFFLEASADVIVGCGYESSEEIRLYDFVENARGYANTLSANTETSLPVTEGTQPEAKGNVTTSLLVTSAYDAQGRVTTLSASGISSQSGSVVRSTAVYRDSRCSAYAVSQQAQYWQFTVTDGPVKFVTKGSVNFTAGEYARASASQNRWELRGGEGTSFLHSFEVTGAESPRTHTIDETLFLEPGDYVLVISVQSYCCDFGEETSGEFRGNGGADFTSTVTLTYP